MATFVDIRKIGGRSLYYPYLDSKNGTQRPLIAERRWLLLYSLFVDRIIITPSSVFAGEFAVQNLADLCSVPWLAYLADTGQLVSTTSKVDVTDLRDLFESYSGLSKANSLVLNRELPIFGRDESYQREVYADHLADTVVRMATSRFRIDAEVADAVKAKPRHAEFLAAIPRISDVAEVQTALSEAAVVSYFFAGAKGNAAITPPVNGQQSHENFDFLYQKEALLGFGLELERSFGKGIGQLTFNQHRVIRRNLSLFREQYFQLAQKHKNVFTNVSQLNQLATPSVRLKAPTVIFQAAVATAIGATLTPIFGFAALGAAIAGKFAWEAFSKSIKLNDKFAENLRKGAVRVGLQRGHEKDLIDAIESFRKGIAASSFSRNDTFLTISK
jgi:hypothetical protein